MFHKLAGERHREDVANGHKRAAAACVPAGLGLAAIIVLLASITTVPSGNSGVVMTFGKVRPNTLGEGFHFISPLDNVEPMSTKVHVHEADYSAASKDMQAVHVKMAINVRLLPDKAAEVYQKIGMSYLEVIVFPAAQEVLKAHTALHNASEILHLRQKIKDDVQASLREWLLRYGIELKEVSLSNIFFGPEYTHAIEQKQIQEQKAEQKKYELIQAEREAEIVKAKAKGDADAAREASKGRADALKIEGEALADYNRRVSESLTPILIQNEYIKRWDGKLPVYSLGTDSKTMFMLPGPEKK